MTITTIEQLRESLIEEGIASVNRIEIQPHKREGCLEGFEIARSLPISGNAPYLRAFEAAIEARHRQEMELHRGYDPRDDDDTREIKVQAYWRYTCATAQIDHVYQRLRIVTGDGPETISGNALAHVHRLLSGALSLRPEDSPLPPPQGAM